MKTKNEEEDSGLIHIHWECCSFCISHNKNTFVAREEILSVLNRPWTILTCPHCYFPVKFSLLS